MKKKDLKFPERLHAAIRYFADEDRDEQAFRINERKDSDAGRFIKPVAGYVGKGIRHAKLTGQEGGGLLPA